MIPQTGAMGHRQGLWVDAYINKYTFMSIYYSLVDEIGRLKIAGQPCTYIPS